MYIGIYRPIIILEDLPQLVDVVMNQSKIKCAKHCKLTDFQID
jgi:hypothetical protein